MRTANPALNDSTFPTVGGASQAMTLQGTVNKTALFLALVLVAAVYTWQKALVNPAAAMELATPISP